MAVRISGDVFSRKKKKPLSMMEGEKKLGLKAGGGAISDFIVNGRLSTGIIS